MAVTKHGGGNSAAAARSARRGLFNALLDGVERVGNRMPDQITIFMALGVVTLLVSSLGAWMGWSIVHPVSGRTEVVRDLLSRDGLAWVLGSVVSNFAGFPPLGTVLVAMIGVGVAERTGLFAALLKLLVMSVPAALVTPTIVFAGIMSNTASDAGYVILPPLAAMLFHSLGRHPLAGVGAAFAGVAGGFSANLLLSTLDPMLAGLTAAAAGTIQNGYSVHAAVNFYFMAASVPVLMLVGWFVSEKIVEPRLGRWDPASAPAGAETAGFAPLEPIERTGLWAALAAFVATGALIAWMVLPENGILRDPGGKDTIGRLKPFFAALVAIIFAVFIVPGIVFGVVTGRLRSDRDAARMMNQTMAAMGGYVVLAFFAAQFIEWFKQSNLGLFIAVGGAEMLKSVKFTGFPLMISFVLVTALFNILMSSASAKWALMAPVFVPMFMLLGKSPEAAQAMYRVGDSCTNAITPLNAYFPILLAVVHRYLPSAGIGTLISMMVPYSIAFLLAWTIMLMGWMAVGAELGPGAGILYDSAAIRAAAPAVP